MPYGPGIGFTYIIVVQVLFFIVTIALILWFIKNNKRGNTPLQTLKSRLAAGEITTKQYDSLLKKIQMEK